MGTNYKNVDRRLLREWEERRKNILSESFIVESAGNKEERIARAREDFEYFARTYFPHLCKKPCAKFHIEAARYIKAHPNARAVFRWPRGHAKSTIMSLIIPLWLLIQEKREINLMLLVSQSEDKAKKLLRNLRAELEINPLFISDFGQMAGGGEWADGEFKTTTGVLFVAVGRGQSPRGLINRGLRPDYIVIDDLDDDELVLNPSRVGRALDWCLSALIGTMAMGRGRFIMVGNLIGKDSVLARMERRPTMHVSVVYGVDKNGRSVWPENYTPKELAELRAVMGERLWQKEMMHNPTVEGSIFRQRDIRYGRMLPLKEYRSLVCYTDPSFKNSSKNDFKATVLLGKTPDGYIHLLKAYVDRAPVSDMVRWHYDIEGWIGGRVPVMFYMESNFIQDLLLDEFRKAGEACGYHIPVRGDARKKPDKFARIEAIQPLFERGIVIFNEDERESPGMRELVDQLLMFERGSRTPDDAPDALEGGIFKLQRRTLDSVAPYVAGRRPSRKY